MPVIILPVVQRRQSPARDPGKLGHNSAAGRDGWSLGAPALAR